MNRGKQTALVFTILMIVFVLYGEFQRRSAEEPAVTTEPQVPDVPKDPQPKMPKAAHK